MDLKVEYLDSEWTVFIRCPFDGCKVITHACCTEHGRESMQEHIAWNHA